MNDLKLVIHPSSYEISPYKLGDIPSLERWMSLWDPHIFEYVYNAFDYSKKDKTLFLPRGVNQNKLEYTLRKKYKTLKVEDRSKYETIEAIRNGNLNIKTSFKPRNKLQSKSIEFLTINPTDARFGQKMLNLNTGEGKTFCALYSCLKSGSKPLIAMNAINLANQWKEKILEYTDIAEDEIYIISGRKSIDDLIDMSMKDISKIKFYIAIYRTLTDYINSPSDQYRMDITSLLYDKAKINVKIFDEVHVHYQAIMKIDYKLSKAPSIYLTATPERADRIENELFQSIFNQVPRLKSPNKNGSYGRYRHVVVCKFDTNPSMTDIANIKKASTRGFSYNAYNNYLMENKSSMGIYFRSLNDVYKELCIGNKTALLVKNINMIEELVALFQSQPYIQNRNIKVRAYHGKIPKKEKNDIIENADLIITTDASLGKGMDVPNLTRVISTINTSSIVSVTQIAGRLRYIPDKELYYIDMVDIGFTDIRRQLSKRMKFYKGMAKSINEVEL